MGVNFIIPGDSRQLTGGYIYNRKLIEGLSAAGNDVQIINPGNDFPFPGEQSRAKVSALFKSLPHGEAIIIDSLALGALNEFIPALKSKNRIIALMHLPLFMDPTYSEADRERFKISETQCLQQVDVVVTTSGHTKKILFELGIGEDKIHVITPGTENGPRILQYPDLPEKLLCVSNYTVNKNQSLLIKALTGLVHLPWTLHCYGNRKMDKSYYAQLQLTVTNLGLKDRIVLHGPVDHENLQRIYHQFDLFVLPSQYETYGMVLAEALVHGLPVVAAHTGGIPQTIPKGTGMLFEPGNITSLRSILAKLFVDMVLYKNLCQKSKESRNQFSTWADSLNKIIRILNRPN